MELLHDSGSPPARAQEIAERVPNSRLVVIDGPHTIHPGQPAECSRAVADHLRRAPGEAA